MKITQLNIYPIKSLRGISLPTATLCAQGVAYDRRYVLLKRSADGTYSNMFVGNQPEMALFHCALSSSSSPSSSFTVSYHIPHPPVTPPHPSQSTTISIPLEPDCRRLQQLHIHMHTTPTYPAHRMPDPINAWFSSCFGYDVILAYTGDTLGLPPGRDDERARDWIAAIKPAIPAQLRAAVTFSDGAALLVASEASLAALHSLLPDGEEVVLEKFRPNIVVGGVDGGAWDEDFWGEVTVSPLGARIVLTANCSRCRSINVDLEKGRMGEGASGQMLKKMMRDRRVDKGSKWSPIFGRYGFPTQGGEVSVGDEVLVSKRNNEHTVWNGVMPRLAKLEQVTV